MQVANSIAQFSPDQKTKVGALLLHNVSGSVLSTGYNGFIRNANDAELPSIGDEKYDYIVHAETNLLFSAARHGVRTSECFIICTLSPCINCLRSLYQAGIVKVYFRDTYKDFHKNLKMKDLIIDLSKVGEYTKLEMKGSKL